MSPKKLRCNIKFFFPVHKRQNIGRLFQMVFFLIVYAIVVRREIKDLPLIFIWLQVFLPSGLQSVNGKPPGHLAEIAS